MKQYFSQSTLDFANISIILRISTVGGQTINGHRFQHPYLTAYVIMRKLRFVIYTALIISNYFVVLELIIGGYF